MPEIIDAGMISQNPKGALTNIAIVNFSVIKLFANVNPSIGESITHIRFHIYIQGNMDNPFYSPEIEYTGGYIEYEFGIMNPQWVDSTTWSSNSILGGFGLKSNKINPAYSQGRFGLLGYVITSPYRKPNISRFNVLRDEPETKANIEIKFDLCSLKVGSTEYNNAKFKCQFYNGNTWIDINTWVIESGLVFDYTISFDLPFELEKSYEIKLLIEDIFNDSTVIDILPTSSVPLSLGKKGIGVGKIHERGVMDMFGDFWKNDILQPTIFKKKPTDPTPDNMEDGDVLIVFNDMEAFSSANFPQEFGTGYVWAQTGVWPTLYAYWTSMTSSSNPLIESFECSSFKGDGYPILMFDGIKSTDPGAYANGFFIPLESVPVTIVFKFKGKVQFNSFALNGWGQDHEIKNSPKSFVFFGSNDGHTWDTLYDTTSFEDSWKTTKYANMLNSGNYYEYFKMVFRSNQDDNAGINGSMIAIGELSFNCSGYRYV